MGGRNQVQGSYKVRGPEQELDGGLGLVDGRDELEFPVDLAEVTALVAKTEHLEGVVSAALVHLTKFVSGDMVGEICTGFLMLEVHVYYAYMYKMYV